MKKKFLVLLVFCFFVFSVFADDGNSVSATFDSEKLVKVEQELSKILNPKVVKELVEKNKFFEYKYNKTVMRGENAPKLKVWDKMQSAMNQKDFEPVLLMESLYIFPRENSDASHSVDIAKILKSISKLKGLQYYSHSRKMMRLLYAESCAVKKLPSINGPEYQTILDPIDEPTDGLSVLACQKDLTFGRYIYRYDYFAEDGAVGTVCSNTQTLQYKIFNAIFKENLKVGLIAKEFDDFVLVYCITEANFSRVPGLKKKLKNSFSSRADAMYKWFVEEYKKADK